MTIKLRRLKPIRTTSLNRKPKVLNPLKPLPKEKKKRKPIKRKPLKPKKPRKLSKPKPRKKLRQRSLTSKRSRETTEYLKLRIPFLEANPQCCFPGCDADARDVHHAAGRRGGAFLDQATWKPVCRFHHRLIHDFPKDAKNIGLIIRNYKPSIITE